MSCPDGYFGTSNSQAPCRRGTNCYWQTGSGSNCAEKGSTTTRLCSCTCAAGSFSPSDTQPYPCTRYDKIPTLPSHLRLRKARPTQLFLSMFFSPWPSSVSDSPNPLTVVSQANGKMVRDSLSAKTAWPASSRPRLVRHQTRAKTALSTPTPLLPRVYTMTVRLMLVLPAPVSL